MRAGMLAGLMRKDGERWKDLLLRLNDAVMKVVVDGYQIGELRLSKELTIVFAPSDPSLLD